MQRLIELVDIHPGYPFRGKVAEVPGGRARVVQMKDVDKAGYVYWDKLVRTDLQGRREPDWLQVDDVLFLLRGNNNYALVLRDAPFPVVASPHFFLLRVKSSVPLLPGFLAWQLNQRSAQRYFDASAEGSWQRSIRRGILENLSLAIPDVETQKSVVGLADAVRLEVEAHNELIANRKQMLNSVASKILNTRR